MSNIQDWDINPLLRGVVRRLKCTTADDIASRGRAYWGRTPGVGRISLTDLDELLTKAGLTWFGQPESSKAPAPQQRTVRVRILVATDDKGNWTSAGYWSGEPGNDPMEWIACEDLTETIRYHWIEADVPYPEPETTIAGEVSAAEGWER